MTAGNTHLNQTGNGVVLTAPGLTAHVFSIGSLKQESAPIQDSDLSNPTYESFVPGDLINPGRSTADIGFNGPLPALNVLGTITLTFPKLDGSVGAGAILSGSGFLFEAETPSVANGQLLKSKIGFCFDGKAAIPGWTGTP